VRIANAASAGAIVAWLSAGAPVRADPAALRAGITRIHVQPVQIQSGADDFKAAVIAQVKKTRSVEVVNDGAAADFELVGKSEVWIKGYQSLNPRSGRLPANGTPIYGGFLSVELTNAAGDTIWSYLVSENSTDDIFRRLAKQLASHLAAYIAGRPPARSTP
jgi:hypothetical protein